MDPEMPGASTLYNYDIDRDAAPGLVIAKGGSGPNESDPTKHQAWQWPVPTVVTIEGLAQVKLWSATKEFLGATRGAVSAYLRDCDGSSCVDLGGGTISDSNWQGGSPSWVQKTLTFPVGTHTIAAGHSVELVVVVEPSSADDMWFAYDTGPDRSRVSVSITVSGALAPGVAPPSAIAGWLEESWARLLFA
jgi:hypothetical protein